MTDAISYALREPVADAEMVDLVVSHGGNPSAGWWDRISAHSLGWVSARDHNRLLVGFVNVAWDGGDHAFLIDTKARGSHQRQGIGAELLRWAVVNARAAGCEWLHVDFEPELARFYFDACGFGRTDAGLVHLSPLKGTNSPRREAHGWFSCVRPVLSGHTLATDARRKRIGIRASLGCAYVRFRSARSPMRE